MYTSFIQYGVTTVLDMHNEREWFREINAITRQRNDVSDVKSWCYGATIKNGWPSAIVRLVSQEENVRTGGGFKRIYLSDFFFGWRIASLMARRSFGTESHSVLSICQ
jgi:hypothetical protein